MCVCEFYVVVVCTCCVICSCVYAERVFFVCVGLVCCLGVYLLVFLVLVVWLLNECFSCVKSDCVSSG